MPFDNVAVRLYYWRIICVGMRLVTASEEYVELLIAITDI